MESLIEQRKVDSKRLKKKEKHHEAWEAIKIVAECCARFRAVSAYFFFRSILMEAISHTFTSEVCLKPLSYTGNRFDAG